MPEINYKELDRHLQGLSKENFPSVCLIYGEESLYKNALNAVLDLLLPGPERNLCYEPVENDNVYDAIAQANTFSLLSGTRVVALPDSRIFYAKQDDGALLEKTKNACDAKEMKKAAKFFTSLLGKKKLSFDDVAGENRHKALRADSEILGNGKWMDDLIGYCTDRGLSPTGVQDTAGDLQKAVERGLPAGNFLMITADMVDRRRGLFKAIKTNGLIVDCSVPKGSGRANQMARDAILKERMNAILAKSGTRMDMRAYQTLCDMTGFDLRTFAGNLEKLVDYVGERRQITARDVTTVLKRTKQDPIYELTNAVASRNAGEALFFLNSLLAEGLFSLQVLAAIINQMRKLLLAKGFLESPQGRVWRSGMTYNQFQKDGMAAVQAWDRLLAEQLEAWDERLSDGEADKKNKKKKSKPATDLMIGGKSPYPVYLLIQRAERFTGAELAEIMERLGEADLTLKTSARNPKLVLERLILSICRPSGDRVRDDGPAAGEGKSDCW
ncbi:DNA polymerase III subunit delta [Desulfonema ishimotonii]|uniref:DNA-directed DNA polymerase n=1 Tax=Desulfonema ishimotonii TaxID=45657 RepID=A0A401FUU7_9BACT|nr:hypothetical protein [Desulfonema ishimotonii]GBC60725.1 DNA polymerase III subunit delta [Desulfonema ishimotonii]